MTTEMNHIIQLIEAAKVEDKDHIQIRELNGLDLCYAVDREDGFPVSIQLILKQLRNQGYNAKVYFEHKHMIDIWLQVEWKYPIVD